MNQGLQSRDCVEFLPTFALGLAPLPLMVVPEFAMGTWLSVLGLGLGFLVVATRRFGLLRRIEDSPASRVRSAAIGEIEASGRVEALGPCTDPLDGGLSPLFCCEVRQLSLLSPLRAWRTVDRLTRAVPFLLVGEEGGRIQVDPAKCSAKLLDAAKQEVGAEPAVGVRRYLSARGIARRGWLGTPKPLRLVVRRVRARDALWVKGVAQPDPGLGIPIVAARQDGDPIPLLAHGSEERLQQSIRWAARAWLALGAWLVACSASWGFGAAPAYATGEFHVWIAQLDSSPWRYTSFASVALVWLVWLLWLRNLRT